MEQSTISGVGVPFYEAPEGRTIESFRIIKGGPEGYYALQVSFTDGGVDFMWLAQEKNKIYAINPPNRPY